MQDLDAHPTVTYYHYNLGMAIRVRVLDTCRIPDSTGTGMRMIFYLWVVPIPDPNRDGYGWVFFPPTGNPMGTGTLLSV
jgi:hypothetical protein